MPGYFFLSPGSSFWMTPVSPSEAPWSQSDLRESMALGSTRKSLRRTWKKSHSAQTQRKGEARAKRSQTSMLYASIMGCSYKIYSRLHAYQGARPRHLGEGGTILYFMKA